MKISPELRANIEALSDDGVAKVAEFVDFISTRGRSGTERRAAYWTYSAEYGNAYYFAPANVAPPPYRCQRHVDAILDIAEDGTLAGIELVFGDLPPPPLINPPKEPTA